jgi:hypothetical protein
MTTTAAGLYGAAVFAVTVTATLGGHEAGDYLAQTDQSALGKQQPCRAGRRALNRHVRSLAATQLVFTALALEATGLRVPAHAVLAGAVVNAVTHWVIDRGPFLAWAAAKLNKADHATKTGFYYRGCGLSTGRTAMDQATHRAILPVAAAVTAVLARRAAVR